MLDQETLVSCFIWGSEYDAQRLLGSELPISEISHNESIHVISPRTGGVYEITGKAIRHLEYAKLTTRGKARLTTWIVDERERGKTVPRITVDLIDRICLSENSIEISISERSKRLLWFIKRESEGLGSEFNLQDHELAAMAWSESTSKQDIVFLLRDLSEQNCVEIKQGSEWTVAVTPAGYRYIEDQTVNLRSHEAFVAMWFSNEMKELWEEGIKPGVLDAGYKPIRIDEEPRVTRIDIAILEKIEKSRFLVVDTTQGCDGPRASVYFEAGYASGLKLPIIYTCREEMVNSNSLPFDIRQLSHLTWQTPEGLRAALTKKIRSDFGYGPLLSTE